MYLEKLTKLLNGPELQAPYPPYPCKCGHGVFDHGTHQTDTSCTECECEKYIDQTAPRSVNESVPRRLSDR